MTKQTRSRLTVLGIVVVVAGGIAVSPLPTMAGNYVDMLQAMRAFDKANAAYEVKEYDEALRWYEVATENAPADNAIIQATLRFFTASSNHLLYNPGLTDDPVNEERLEAAREGYEETIGVVEDGLQDPLLEQGVKDTIALYEQYSTEQLAGLYRDYFRDMDKSIEYFDRLIEMAPDEPGRYYALADVYERFHDEEENPLLDMAIATYERPVEMNPDDPIGYRQVANLLNKYGRFDETMEWLARARDVNADNPEGYYLIATYYWDKVYRDPDLTQRQRREFIELGIGQLDAALELNDEYVDALVYKNLLLREKAKVEPQNANALIAEADEYRSRALAIRDAIAEAQRQAAVEAAEAAAEGR